MVKTAPRRFQDVSKTLSRRFFFVTVFQCLFRIDFGSTWTPTWGPTWPQKSTKIHGNRENEAFPRELQFLIDFWSIFSFNFDPQNPQNYCFSIGKTKFFEKIAFRSWPLFRGPTWAQRASILASKIRQNPKNSDLQRHSKMDWKNASNFDRFGVRFGG